MTINYHHRSRRLPARLPRYLRDPGHGAGRPGDQGAGGPRSPADARCVVYQGVALSGTHLSPRTRVASAAAGRAEGQRAVRAGRLGRGAGRHRRAARRDRRPRSAGHRAVQLCRHDGSGAGRVDGRPILSPPGCLAARPHDLRERRKRGAHCNLRRQGRHARRALRREPVDPDLGQQPDRLQACISGHSRRLPSGPVRG